MSRRVPSLLLAVLLLAFVAAAHGDTGELEHAIERKDWPAALSLLGERLAERPDDPALRFRRAQVLGWSGDPQAALAAYDGLLADYPDNVDYVYGRALALRQLGREAEALQAARRAARLAPDYEAVRRLELRLARGRLPEAEVEALTAEASDRFPGAGWWRSDTSGDRSGSRGQTRYFLTAGAGYESLTDGLPGWQQQFVRLDREDAGPVGYHASVSRYERYDRSDTELGLGGRWQAGDDWSLELALALAGGADFLPETGVSGRVRRQLGDGWNVAAGLRQRRYEETTVTTWSGEAEHYFGNYRAAYRLNASRLHGAATSLSHVVSLGWYPRAGLSFGLVAATGEEAEVIAPGQILETDVDSLTLTGRHALTPRVTLDWWLGTHRQGDIYRRRYAGLAVRYGL